MDADVIIAGLGAHGSSAAFHLAKRGTSVLGFERFARGHTLGSSGGLSRIIRLSYYEHPDYVPLLRRAWTLWRELEAESGERLLTETGGLYAGRPDGTLVAGALASAREYGLEHEHLGTADLRERFPLFEWPDAWTGVFERQAGWLAPERSIETHLALAERNGATLRFEEPIEAWESTFEGIRVHTASGAAGTFELNADGTFSSDSKITFDLTTLSSDQRDRDNFVKQDTLGVRQFPTATFVPTKVTGLTLPMPASGSFTFTLAGNLTLHGTTKDVTFDVTAKRDGSSLTATATNNPTWKFADFGMRAPSVPFRVVSVVDEIRLSVDLVATGPTS